MMRIPFRVTRVKNDDHVSLTFIISENEYGDPVSVTFEFTRAEYDDYVSYYGEEGLLMKLHEKFQSKCDELFISDLLNGTSTTNIKPVGLLNCTKPHK